MRALVKKEARRGAIELQKVPKPSDLGPREVLIRVNRVSICGSDVHIYEWNKWAASRIRPPRIIGHEFTGEVVKLGSDVELVKEGDIVVAESHIPCMACYQCRTGKMHVCRNTKIIGVDVDGAFADYVKLPEVVLWKIDPSIPAEYASVMEPLGNAIHTASVANLSGKSVLITGVGPIGAMAIAVTKASGSAPIIAAEIKPYRIKMARKIGADYVINPTEQDLVEEVMKITEGNGVDVFLEMSGNPKALADGIKAVTNGGKVSVLGVYDGRIEFDMNLAVFKALTIYGITGREMFKTWHVATQMLKYKQLDLSSVVTHVLDFDDWEEGMELMQSGNCGKIVLKLND
ncbi:MAG: L-threonine 3-dehydrogenase [Thermotogae bacterium]|nr:MAG: L-threonine 3-dehydrogenase [Thermotogota bacterium]